MVRLHPWSFLMWLHSQADLTADMGRWPLQPQWRSTGLSQELTLESQGWGLLTLIGPAQLTSSKTPWIVPPLFLRGWAGWRRGLPGEKSMCCGNHCQPEPAGTHCCPHWGICLPASRYLSFPKIVISILYCFLCVHDQGQRHVLWLLRWFMTFILLVFHLAQETQEAGAHRWRSWDSRDFWVSLSPHWWKHQGGCFGVIEEVKDAGALTPLDKGEGFKNCSERRAAWGAASHLYIAKSSSCPGWPCAVPDTAL